MKKKKQLTKLFCILNVIVIMSLILPTQVFAYTTNSSSVKVQFRAVAADDGSVVPNFRVNGTWNLSSNFTWTGRGYGDDIPPKMTDISGTKEWGSWSGNITLQELANIGVTYPSGTNPEQYVYTVITGVNEWGDPQYEGVVDITTGTVSKVTYTGSGTITSGSGNGYFIPSTSLPFTLSGDNLHGQTLTRDVTVYPETNTSINLYNWDGTPSAASVYVGGGIMLALGLSPTNGTLPTFNLPIKLPIYLWSGSSSAGNNVAVTTVNGIPQYFNHDISISNVADSPASLTAKVVYGIFTITAKESTTQQGIPGITYSAFNEWGEEVFATTDSNGVATFNLPAVTQTFTEISFPKGYKNRNLIFTMDPGTAVWTTQGSAKSPSYSSAKNVTYTYDVSLDKNSLTIFLEDDETGEPISGGKFEVIQGGSVIKTLFTNVSGHAVFENIDNGQYLVRQVSTANHYEFVQEEIPVTISGADQEIIFKNTRQKGKLMLHMADAVTGYPIAGIGMLITGPGVNSIVYTDENGLLPLDDLSYGTYTIVEYDVPMGYKTRNLSFPLTLDASMDNQLLTFKYNPVLSSVKLNVVDAETGANIRGLVYEVLNEYDYSFGEVAVNLTGDTYISNLPLGNYTLQLISGNSKYTDNIDCISFSLLNEQQLPIRIEAAALKGNIVVEAVDSLTGNAADPFSFALSDADGNYIDTFSTDGYGKIYINNLPCGDYMLTEISRPAGYEISDTPIWINLTNDTLYFTHTSRRMTGGADIELKDAKSGEHISGETDFKLINSENDQIFYEFTINGGYIGLRSIPRGTYYLRQETVPDGYLKKAGTIAVEISYDGEIPVYTLENEPKSSDYELNTSITPAGKDIGEDTEGSQELIYFLQGDIAEVSFTLTNTSNIPMDINSISFGGSHHNTLVSNSDEWEQNPYLTFEEYTDLFYSLEHYYLENAETDGFMTADEYDQLLREYYAGFLDEIGYMTEEEFLAAAESYPPEEEPEGQDDVTETEDSPEEEPEGESEPEDEGESIEPVTTSETEESSSDETYDEYLDSIGFLPYDNWLDGQAAYSQYLNSAGCMTYDEYISYHQTEGKYAGYLDTLNYIFYRPDRLPITLEPELSFIGNFAVKIGDHGDGVTSDDVLSINISSDTNSLNLIQEISYVVGTPPETTSPPDGNGGDNNNNNNSNNGNNDNTTTTPPDVINPPAGNNDTGDSNIGDNEYAVTTPQPTPTASPTTTAQPTSTPTPQPTTTAQPTSTSTTQPTMTAQPTSTSTTQPTMTAQPTPTPQLTTTAQPTATAASATPTPQPTGSVQSNPSITDYDTLNYMVRYDEQSGRYIVYGKDGSLLGYIESLYFSDDAIRNHLTPVTPLSADSTEEGRKNDTSAIPVNQNTGGSGGNGSDGGTGGRQPGTISTNDLLILLLGSFIGFTLSMLFMLSGMVGYKMARRRYA